MEIALQIAVLIAVLSGVVLLLKGKKGGSAAAEEELRTLRQAGEEARQHGEQLRSEKEEGLRQLAAERAKSEEIDRQRETLTEELQKAQGEVQRLNNSLTAVETTLRQERQTVEELQTRFREEFKNLSQQIFTEKGRDFAAFNKEQLDKLLSPLAEKIKTFEEEVKKSNKEDLERTATLKEQIRLLTEQSGGLGKQAEELARALRSDNKAAGDYGEILLKQLLDDAGLLENIHYVEQGTGLKLKGEEGNALKPDVLLKLPDNRVLIVDSKMSLSSYTDWVNSESDADRAKAENAFYTSTKNHIDNLQKKKYPTAFEGGTTIDMVLLFIPIEQAFHLALRQRQEKPLYNYAWDRGIVLVSPTTLLALARTVHHIWKRDAIGKNAEEIAGRAGLLYDKFVNFINDLAAVEKKLDEAKAVFGDAKNKLTTGSGNLVRQAEMLRDLGAKSDKRIPESFLSD